MEKGEQIVLLDNYPKIQILNKVDLNLFKKIDIAEIINKLERLQINILSELIKDEISLSYFNPPNREVNAETINFMLLNNEQYNLVFQTHKLIVSQIIYYAFFNKVGINRESLKKYLFSFSKINIDNLNLNVDLQNILKNISKEEACKVLDKFHEHYLNSKYFLKKGVIVCERSFINYKDRGSVYTPEKISKEITYNTIENKLQQGISLNEIKILDFGCATGAFLLKAFEYLTEIKKLNKRDVLRNNLWGVDIDGIALDILKIKFFYLLGDSIESDLELINRKIIKKNMLTHIEDFPNEEIQEEMFDVVVSNPPYFLLKVNKKISNDKNMDEYYSVLKERIDHEVNYFRKSGFFKYSVEGMLNYYKLSLEVIIKLCKKNGEIGVICPSTLFSDLSSKKLRKHILLNNNLRSIKYFPESTKIFENISQSTVIFYMQKSEKTSLINISSNGESFDVSLDLIKKAFCENYEIPYIKQLGWSILDKISNYTKLKELSNIRNKRGELDLTFFKKFITKENTGLRLIRGNMIKEQGIIDNNHEFVLKEFLDEKSSDYLENDFQKKRLACQQISNLDIKKRLKFVYLEKNDIVANSCNYLSILNGDSDKIKDILNSYLLNWRFKITSSNNHINNYELGELPIIDLNKFNSFGDEDILKNIRVCRAYGLKKEEIIYILQPHFKLEKIKEKLKNENI